MKVRDVMTSDVEVIEPHETVRQAAKMMANLDAGALPVGENDRLVGMITDRDIAIRVIAEDKGPDTVVRDAMTKEVKYCFDDEDIEDVAQNMGGLKVRRLPVVNRNKRLVGIISLGDIATSRSGNDAAGEALSSISEHGGQHNQTRKS